MTINLRSVASLGIGFGVAAVAGLGLVAVVATQSAGQGVDSTALFTPAERATTALVVPKESSITTRLQFSAITRLREESCLLVSPPPIPQTAVMTSLASSFALLYSSWTTYTAPLPETRAFSAAQGGSVLTWVPYSTVLFTVLVGVDQTFTLSQVPSSTVSLPADEGFYQGDQAT